MHQQFDQLGQGFFVALVRQPEQRLAAGFSLYRRALAIREKVLGPNHPDVATSLNNLGNLLTVKGELAAAEELLARWRALPQGADAAMVGEVRDGQAHVLLETAFGGQRILEELEDDPLPRIC